MPVSSNPLAPQPAVAVDRPVLGDGSRSTARAGWHGAEGLFVWIHRPAGPTARAGVVLCPSFGPEQHWGYGVLRLMADLLADRGYVVVRFDWAGTGQSLGDAAGRWPDGGLLASVEHAVEVVRATGVERLALVGSRLGASAAGSWVAAHGPVDAAVLWDPCPSGRAFLREQRALRLLQGAGDSDVEAPPGGTGGVEGVGFFYPPQGVADLKTLGVPGGASQLADRVLVVHRGGEPIASGTRLVDTPAVAARSSSLLEESLRAGLTPEPLVADTVEWLVANLPGAPAALRQVPLTPEVVSRTWPSGAQVRERVVALGPLGLFGIETSPVRLPPPTKGTPATDRPPTVVFLDVAAEPCVGPGRLWVRTARSLAAAGTTSVRFNSSGLGDSPVRPGQRRGIVYAPEAVDDMEAVAHDLRPFHAGDVILVGQCSGAYNALEASTRLHARGVVAINPILDADLFSSTDPGLPKRLVAIPRRRWVVRLSRHRAIKRIRSSVPGAVWRLLDRTHLVRSPARGIQPPVEAGTDVLLICGNEDARRYLGRGRWVMDRLTRTGRLTFTHVEGMDHGLLLHRQQQEVARMLLDHLRAAPSAGVPPSAGSPRCPALGSRL